MIRLVKWMFSANTLGGILLLAALGTLSYGISASLVGTDASYLFWVCLAAAWLGLLLSRRRWSGPVATAAVVIVGMVGIWILGARLADPLLDLLRSLFALLPQVVPAVREHTPVDYRAVTEAWLAARQASSILWQRWQLWFLGLDRNITVEDALIRDMLWAMIMWLIAAWTGWYAARRNAILALLPGIALLALVVDYSEYKPETLWLLVFLLLLLMGIWKYRNQIHDWEQQGVDYSDSIRYDSTQAVILLVAMIGLLSFITPSLSLRQIREFLRQHNRSSQAAEVLGIQQQQVPVTKIAGPQPELPREHLLTEGFEQSQEIVMTVRTGELPPIPDRLAATMAPRYYWRSTVYDEYLGTGWVTSVSVPQSYKANAPLIPGLLNGYRPLHLQVQLLQPEGKLFWSGMLYSADHPFRVDWRARPESNLFPDQTALLQADVFTAASSDTDYGVESYLPVASEDELRAASTDYPEGLRNRYLQLPYTVTDRVRQLAQQIVRAETNPYDKARAIERYLRSNYPYDLDVPVPPQDQDVADYFLFDLKKGYCDYYATAMVVLARSAGLPARFVSGYSSGSYDAANAQYVVRELNAHSWAEVYFPEIGWIEFEPTGSEPEIERLEKNLESSNTSTTVTPMARLLFQLTHGKILYVLYTLAALSLLLILYFAVFERIFFLSLAPPVALARLYRRYYRLAGPLAGRRSRGETAYEFTDKLVRKVQELERRWKNGWMLQPIPQAAETLTTLYCASLFSNHGTRKSDVGAALQLWKRLRRSLIAARLYATLRKVIRHSGNHTD